MRGSKKVLLERLGVYICFLGQLAECSHVGYLNIRSTPKRRFGFSRFSLPIQLLSHKRLSICTAILLRNQIREMAGDGPDRKDGSHIAP